MEREDIERFEAAFKSECGPSPKAPPPGDDDQSKAMKIEVNTSEEVMRMGGKGGADGGGKKHYDACDRTVEPCKLCHKKYTFRAMDAKERRVSCFA